MRFFVGDENGQLKSVRCTQTPGNKWDIKASTLDDGGMQGKTRAIQRLAIRRDKIALARSDGSCSLFHVEGDDSVKIVEQWQETRAGSDHSFIGLDLMESGSVVSCTTAGRLRLQLPQNDEQDISSRVTSIPTRLCELIVTDDAKQFAYGGAEVEVSLWDTTRAFDPSRQLLPASTAGKKRRKDYCELIDGEIWRAKNVSNDFLNLRQPVHNTTLSFLPPTGHQNGGSHHILAGTRIGSVRRYDTRAARKPVADWTDIGKVGGIRKVHKGITEHDAFVADNGGNLFALDLRTGRILYAYSSIAGAISSLSLATSSMSPPLLASTSLDRFFRLHSVYEAPKPPRNSLDKKGEVLNKHWIVSAACCAVWDGVTSDGPQQGDKEADADDVWAGMQDVYEGSSGRDDLEEEEHGINPKKHKAR